MAENLLIAVDVESSSAMCAPAVTTAHNPYWRYVCMGGMLTLLSDSEQSSLTIRTLSPSFPIYILLRKSFKEWELQCNSLGRKGGNAELEAGVSFIQTGESRRDVPSLGAECESQARSGAMLSNVPCCQGTLDTFPFLLWEVSPYPLRWVLWVLTHYECWVSSELIEALPNRVLFPFG